MLAGIGAVLLAVGAYRLLTKPGAPVTDEGASQAQPSAAPAEARPSPPTAAAPAVLPREPVPASPAPRAETAPSDPGAPSEPTPQTRPTAGPFGMRSARPSQALQQASGRMGDAMSMAQLRELAKTDPAQALELARAGNVRYPQSPFAGERAAIAVKALLAQGETAKARAEAERAVNRYPDGPWVGELEQLTGVHRDPATKRPPAP